MLVELSMVEQRYDAVREVLDGATVTDVAIRYGVDRRTLHRWLVRYANEGLTALADKAPDPIAAPIRCLPRSRPASSRCAGVTRLGTAHDLERPPHCSDGIGR
jgi:transposase-like protein